MSNASMRPRPRRRNTVRTRCSIQKSDLPNEYSLPLVARPVVKKKTRRSSIRMARKVSARESVHERPQKDTGTDQERVFVRRERCPACSAFPPS